jgi:hypothetical protein
MLFSLVFSLDEQDEIGFLYGILGRLSPQNDVATVLQDTAKIHTGDQVRINAGYKKGTHLYVIYKGSEGEFALLYPENDNVLSNSVDLPDTIYATVLPWSPFTDPTGYETFFLINSTTVRENLTNLFKRYDKTNEKGRKKLAKKIQNEIDSLNPDIKQDLSTLGSRLNKPVVGGVTFRGDDDEDQLKDISLTHSCRGNSGIAFKKIILNHQ